MLRGSFWLPEETNRRIVLLAVLLMIPLHQSELFGLMSPNTLIFGWLPIQLAFDVAYLLVGIVILYAMYRIAPEPPAELEPTATKEEEGVESSQEHREKPVGGGDD